MYIKELTQYELMCLDTLKETCNEFEMNNDYSIGKNVEQRVCISKRELWEVYIVERTLEFDKCLYEDCKDACKRLIYQCSYNDQEYVDALNVFNTKFESKKQDSKLLIKRK